MRIKAADLFCGAGGSSSGLRRACASRGFELDLLAVNHWSVAIETHTQNHPDATHLCETLDGVDPRKVVPGRFLNLLIASPECTHHSLARGGKPIHDQSRASAWHICRWAEALKINNILIENVKEFRTWGPLGTNGRPLMRRKGETYLAFLNALRSLGYTVEDKVLCAADHGDPTTRERLFIMARRGNRKIVWPTASHGQKASTLFEDDGMKPWRAAREIIDWELKGASIFDRKRPLAESTMNRIMEGLRKFGGAKVEPFLLVLRNHADARSLDEPVPTLTASGQHFGVVEPFFVGVGGPEGSARPRSVGEPMNTVLTENHTALCEPVIVPLNHGGKDTRSYGLDRPFPTVTTVDAWGIAQPFIIPQFGGNPPRSVEKPLNTLTTTSRGIGLVEPVIVKYYGTATARPVSEPLDTVTVKDRFALVEPVKDGYKLDIRFRMLQPHELARAQGFDDSYKFAGTREAVVKQIGNAVPVGLATALCAQMLD